MSVGDFPPFHPPPNWTWNPQPVGCICPPTSEQTCQNPECPRKPQQTKIKPPTGGQDE